MYGKQQTDYCKIISRLANARPVVCIETGEVFLTSIIAAKAFNSEKDGSIRSACREYDKGNLQHAAIGYHWRKATEEEALEIKKQYCLEFGTDCEF